MPYLALSESLHAAFQERHRHSIAQQQVLLWPTPFQHGDVREDRPLFARRKRQTAHIVPWFGIAGFFAI